MRLAGWVAVFLFVVPFVALGDSAGGGQGVAEPQARDVWGSGAQDGVIEPVMKGRISRNGSQAPKRKRKAKPESTAVPKLPGLHSPMGNVDGEWVRANGGGEGLINEKEVAKDQRVRVQRGASDHRPAGRRPKPCPSCHARLQNVRQDLKTRRSLKGLEKRQLTKKPKDMERFLRSTPPLWLQRRRRGTDHAAEWKAHRGQEADDQTVNVRHNREVTGGGQAPRRRARPPQPNCTGCYSSLNLQSDPSSSSDPEVAE